MDAAELGRPVGRGQAQPLLFDEDEESQDRGELARGDDGVRAIKAAPEGLRTGRTGLGEGTVMEARAGGEPDILFAVEQRTHGSQRHQRLGLIGRFAQRLLGGGRKHGRHRGGDRCAEGVGDGRLVQGPERRQISIVARRYLARVADREAGHMPLGLGVP